MSEELWFEAADDQEADRRARRSMAAAMGRLQGLKPFPLVVRRVLSIMQNPNFRIQDATAAIEEDPPLASSVLRVANSALFSRSTPSESIRQAIVRLGANMLREIIVTVTVSGLFRDASGMGKAIRNHCSGTAAIARVLAREFAPDGADGSFVAGLLHDIGKLLLLQSGEVSYEKKNDIQRWQPDRHHIEERHALGFDHAVLAGHILVQWNLPEPLPRLVAWHHQPSRAYQSEALGPLVAILRVADQLEPTIRHVPEDFDQTAEQMAAGIDCQYAGVDAKRLSSLLDKLYQACNDLTDLLAD